MSELTLRGAPSLLDVMSPEARQALLAVATPISYRNRETIFQRGERNQGMSIVKSGIVRLGNYTKDGRFYAVANLYPGHCFGELTLYADLPRTHHSLAVGATVVDHITAADYQKVVQEFPEVEASLLVMMVNRKHAALEFIEDMRSLALPARVGKVMLGFHNPQADEPSLTVEATQDELADILGVTRVSINHALKDLESMGLINRRYRAIEIPDIGKLYEWIGSQQQLAPLH